MVENVLLAVYAPVQYNLEVSERVTIISPWKLLDCSWLHAASRLKVLGEICPNALRYLHCSITCSDELSLAAQTIVLTSLLITRNLTKEQTTKTWVVRSCCSQK